MRVGIDLDGCAYDFGDSFFESLVRDGVRLREECLPPARWEFYEDLGFSLAEFIDLCNRGVDAGVIFGHGDPFPGVREALQMIRSAGHTIHVVTDRSFGQPGASAQATLRWLAKHDLPYDAITFSADKTVANVDTMVDDKLSNYDALHAAGVATWLLTRPWNQPKAGEDDCTPDGVKRHRVLDMYHYAEEICRA